MRIILIIVGLVVLAVLARLAFLLPPASGVFADHEPVLVERCAPLDVAPGTEDVTIDPATGLAFVSTDAPEDFHPHGISLWTGPDGAQRLFVVNHPAAGGHTIEIFDVGEAGALTHAETIAYPDLTSPNDVLAVGPREFYATNDRAHPTGLLGVAEAYLALPLSNVSHFNGTDGRIVTGGLAYANGINISADGRHVYVAEILGRRVRVYERDAASGDLTRIRALPVPTAPDNIEIAADGALWIGGHPRIFDFVAHAEDESRIAPSHVLRLDPETGESETILMSLAGELNASSVAAVHGDVLIVGAVFDGHVLVCPLD